MFQHRSIYNPVTEWPFDFSGKPDRRPREPRFRKRRAVRSPQTKCQTDAAVPVRSVEPPRATPRGDLFALSEMGVEGGCCWYGCIQLGKRYRVSGLFLQAVRHYCEHHVFSARRAGLRLARLEMKTDGSRKRLNSY